MPIQRDNYYILLSLPCDPPEKDAARIRAALRAKKQEWTRWQDNPSRRNRALGYLAQTADIERVMLDPALRDKEAADAREIRADMLRQFEAELRVLESKGHILPKEADAIAAKYSEYGVTAESVNEFAKCPVSEEPPARQRDDRGEVLDRMTARSIARNLALLGEASLYTFLEEPPYSSIKKLAAAAERKRHAASMSLTPQNTVAQELAGICLRMFDSFDSKQRYDNYLKISKMPAVAELLDEEHARSGVVSLDVLLRIVGFAVEKYAVRVIEAEEFARAYCAAYRIPLGAAAYQIPCPACGGKTPRDGAVCVSCAQPLSGNCPACGEPFAQGPAACASCGFAIAEMGKAARFIGEAENALIENNSTLASRSLLYARHYWPGNPKLASLEKRAALLEERFAKYQSAIDGYVARRQYYAAHETIQEALGRRVRLSAATVGGVAKAIAEFEAKLGPLRENPHVGVEELLRLAAIVADSDELARLLAKHPPAPPESMTAEIDDKIVRLNWRRSVSRGALSYQLVRKQGGAPQSPGDGDVLYEGVTNSFADRNAPLLHEYYYAVFARRGGAYSESGASAGPVTLIPGIENLRLVPMDSAAQLSWTFHPDIVAVHIRRKAGEPPAGEQDGELLPTDRLDGFLDTELENDVEYWYSVAAVCLCGGRRVQSAAVYGSVTLHRAMRPVDEFIVEPMNNPGEFLLRWDAAIARDILLFGSPEPPQLRSGEALPLAELMAGFRSLELSYRRPGEALFQFRQSGGLHLFVAVAHAKFATVGKARYFAHVESFSEYSCEPDGRALAFSFDWPEDVPEAVLTWRFDRFPECPGEPGTTELSCARETFLHDGGLLLREPEPRTYYTALFGTLAGPDGSRAYSAASRLLVSNRPRQEVFYQLSFRRRPFSDNGTLGIQITSAEPFELPEAVIVGKIGRFPLRKSDGLPLFELEGGNRARGGSSFQFSTEALPQNLYLRLFFHDESLYDSILLLPSSNVKIT